LYNIDLAELHIFYFIFTGHVFAQALGATNTGIHD